VLFLAEQGRGHLAAPVAASQLLNKFGRREFHRCRFTASVGHRFSLKILSHSIQGTLLYIQNVVGCYLLCFRDDVMYYVIL